MWIRRHISFLPDKSGEDGAALVTGVTSVIASPHAGNSAINMDSVITQVKKEEPGGGGVEPESPQIDPSVTVSPPPPASSRRRRRRRRKRESKSPGSPYSPSLSSLSTNALWADWVVRNAFERNPLPKAKNFSFLFLIAKRLKFWTSLERILIFS